MCQSGQLFNVSEWTVVYVSEWTVVYVSEWTVV